MHQHYWAKGKEAVVVVPFAAFTVSIALALAGHPRSAVGMVVVALGLSAAMFALHATDSLPISL